MNDPTPVLAPAVPPLENGDHLTRAEFERRYEAMPGAYADPIVAGVKRSFWRWAEPDSGFGVSGDPGAPPGQAQR